MAYITPNDLNMTGSGISTLFTWANEVTKGWYAIGILVILYMFILVSVYMANTKNLSIGFLSAGFITMIVGLFMTFGSLLTPLKFTIVFGVFIISVIAFVLTKE